MAGTQGYRHRGKTNIAFCDGHVEEISEVYNASGVEGFVSSRCGFISPDNSLYSLE
jgi:prepilin-type processing-associated H-X9-DG protein